MNDALNLNALSDESEEDCRECAEDAEEFLRDDLTDDDLELDAYIEIVQQQQQGDPDASG